MLSSAPRCAPSSTCRRKAVSLPWWRSNSTWPHRSLSMGSCPSSSRKSAARTECTTGSNDRHVTNVARFPPIEILRQQSIAILPVDPLGTDGTPMTSTLDHLAPVPFCAMPSPSTDVDVTRREGGTLILRSRIKLEDVSVAPCKRVELSRLRWRRRQSLASSRVPSLAWRSGNGRCEA